jgi:16S rRNA (cytosine967-C5)-methyltransferase
MKKTFHRPLFLAVAGALRSIFQEARYADKVVESVLRSNPKWGSHDRAFIAEQTYDSVRWWRLLWFYLGIEPAYSDTALFRLIGMNLLRQGEVLPSWDEFSGVKELFEARTTDLPAAIAASVPDWLDTLGRAELGEKWDRELPVLNEQADIILRVNTLKTSIPALRQALAETGWESELLPFAPEALRLLRRGNIFQHAAFKAGLFEVQDAGSQLIAPYLTPAPGKRVVDACAGAGGKTLHLATLMQNKGSIIALDTEAWKLKELQKRASRNGIHNIETRHIESTKVIKRLYGTADCLLLDVPCSGTGVLRRNPDAKWKLSPAFLDRVKTTQAEILDTYCKIVKPGGSMVYATCSIFPSENQSQVRKFLKNHPEFSLSSEQTIFPSVQHTDGFYMALMLKGKL